MTTNNSVNMGIQENADGGQVKLGVTQRILKWLGADITLTGSGSNVYTFPASTGTLVDETHDHAGGDGAAITDANLSTSDITTNNASTSKHGFLKKLSNVATEFMDGTGAWSTPAGSSDADRLPAFSARQANGAPTSIPAGSRGVVVCGTEDLDTGNCHNTTTGKFTPNVAGTYLISVAGALIGATAAKDVWVGIRKNGVDSTVRWMGLSTIAAAGYGGASGNINVYLNGTTDYVEFIMYNGDSSSRNTYTTSSSVVTWWQGHRISSSDIAGW